MNRHWTLLAPLMLVLFAALAPPVRADHPRPEQMDVVRDLARRVHFDAALLVQSARQQRHHFSENEDEAIRSFQYLSETADHFYNQVSRYYQEPGHTEGDYRELRQAYRQARPYFHLIHGTEPVQNAINRLQQSMGSLIGYYREERRGGGRYDQLYQAATEIERIADNLKDRAERREDRGRIGEREMERMRDLRSAAIDFRTEVVRHRGDLNQIDPEYATLADRMQRANRVLGAFSRNFQSDFGRLRSLVRQLSYIRPDVYSGGYDRDR